MLGIILNSLYTNKIKDNPKHADNKYKIAHSKSVLGAPIMLTIIV